MSEVLWNIIGVTLVGCLILLVRKTNGEHIHPQILTVFWIVFFVISLLPLSFIAELGSATENIYFEEKVNSISSNRQEEYFELTAKLNNQQHSSILYQNKITTMIETSCPIIWWLGFLLNVALRILRIIKVKKEIRKTLIRKQAHTLIGKQKINIVATEKIGPMVFGIRPAIYIPQKLTDTDVLNSILAHEKTHIARKHHLLLLLIDITSCLYWFLPYYEKIFMRALREDMEYRCDYEVIKKTDISHKEYALHYTMVSAYQSGLDVSLNFSQKQVMKRISRILDFKTNLKKSIGISFLLSMTVISCIIWIANFYLIQDENGFTKWQIKQAKETVVKFINEVNQGNEQTISSYIYEASPLSNVTDFGDMQYDLYEIDYLPSTSNYYENLHKEQYPLQGMELIHLEGIFNLNESEVIWGFTLILDETDGTWKLFDWGQ